MLNIKTNRNPFKKTQAKNSHYLQRMTTALTGDSSSNDGGGVKYLQSIERKYIQPRTICPVQLSALRI